MTIHPPSRTTSSAIRMNSKKRPDRFPASPARLPATERSWQGHGKPPQRTSTPLRLPVASPPHASAETSAASSPARPESLRSDSRASSLRPAGSRQRVRTSSKHSTPGQCLARTSLHLGSASHCQTIDIPARSKPRSKPPTPVKSDPTTISPPPCDNWRKAIRRKGVLHNRRDDSLGASGHRIARRIPA